MKLHCKGLNKRHERRCLVLQQIIICVTMMPCWKIQYLRVQSLAPGFSSKRFQNFKPSSVADKSLVGMARILEEKGC